MGFKKRPLSLYFAISLAFILFLPLFSPIYRLPFFAPYLIIVFYKRSRFLSLWHALFCGLIVDLLTLPPLFGMTSLNYCLVSLILSGQTRNFFEDKASTLPLMTALFSFLSTVLQVILLFAFSQPLSISFLWVLTDLAAMPLVDGLYAFLCFSLPFSVYYKLRNMAMRSKQEQE